MAQNFELFTLEVRAPTTQVVSGTATIQQYRNLVAYLRVTDLPEGTRLQVRLQDSLDALTSNWVDLAEFEEVRAEGNYVVRIPETSPFGPKLRALAELRDANGAYTSGVSAEWGLTAHAKVREAV